MIFLIIADLRRGGGTKPPISFVKTIPLVSSIALLFVVLILIVQALLNCWFAPVWEIPRPDTPDWIFIVPLLFTEVYQ